MRAALAHRDPRVVFVAHETSTGRSAARNLAATASDAPYVAFLDDDDRLVEGGLDARIDALEAHPGAVLAHGRAVAVASDGRPRAESTSAIGDRAPPRLYDGLATQLRGSSPLPSTVCMRRAAFDRAGGFADDLPTGEDWLLFLKTSRLGLFIEVDRPVAFYRRHAGQARGSPVEQERALAIWLRRFFDDPATPDAVRAAERRLRGRHRLWISRNYRHAGARADGRRLFLAAVSDDPRLLLLPRRLLRWIACRLGFAPPDDRRGRTPVLNGDLRAILRDGGAAAEDVGR